MKKNQKLNQWLWKWHFIAGLVSLPFILLLSITGGIYLFKADYEAPIQKPIKEVEVIGEPLPYQRQWEIARVNAKKAPNSMVLPTTKTQATEFVSGRFGEKSSLYVNPYTGSISGVIASNEGLMYKIRKLHGELLLGSWGTKIVELIASWMVVLIITGLFVWWPIGKLGMRGFFVPRIKAGKRIFFRDMHAITGFWLSGLLLLVLGGAFPWTDVVGENFKWVQKVTHTGYPSTWHGIGLNSKKAGTSQSLDNIVAMAEELQLPGEVSISFPKGPSGVFSVSNTLYKNQSAQENHHFDQYSGTLILKQEWQDVGVLMRGRMWLMAFHQGQFGRWNWILMFLISIFLVISSVSAIVSYILRKKKGNWGIPKVPKNFKVSYVMVGLILFLGIIFPLFGVSLFLIWATTLFKRQKMKMPS
nr:PepSY domain-containing protein [Allomuricauda sp.]